MSAITLTPTAATGARGRQLPYVSVPPERAMDDDAIRDAMSELGLDAAFVADLLSAVLAHERCGRHLYRSVAGRTRNPVLQGIYEEFGDETERHVEILEQLIGSMGGDAQYVSPAARATEYADGKTLEATFLLAGSGDAVTAELAMLDAVLAAEGVDQANWAALARLSEHLPEGDLATQFIQSVNEVILQEDRHLTWARDTRTTMIALRAQHGSGGSGDLAWSVERWFA